MLENMSNLEFKCIGWERDEKDKLKPRKADLSSAMDPEKLARDAGRFEFETHAMETSTCITRRCHFKIENCLGRRGNLGMFSRANVTRLGCSKHHVH